MTTYRDGVQIERCGTCQSALRGADDAILVSVRRDDVEYVAALLRTLPLTQPWLEMLTRFDQAVGQEIAPLVFAESIPPGVKTDRGGLVKA